MVTDHVETRSGQASRYAEYMATGKKRYEIEHIWANHPERHKDEFCHPSDFGNMRNRIGGLLLLPKSSNAKSALMHDLLTGHVSADAIERSILIEITT